LNSIYDQCLERAKQPELSLGEWITCLQKNKVITKGILAKARNASGFLSLGSLTGLTLIRLLAGILDFEISPLEVEHTGGLLTRYQLIIFFLSFSTYGVFKIQQLLTSLLGPKKYLNRKMKELYSTTLPKDTLIESTLEALKGSTNISHSDFCESILHRLD